MIGNKNRIINWLLEQDKDKLFEIKEYKKKRNNNQNSRYWKLLSELSLKTKISIEELHFDMLKNYSPRYEILVPSENEIRGIEYYEKKSKIIKNGKEFTVYHVFTPSHELKTDEFAILLNGLIQECKLQGIETRSLNEILMEEKFYE
jgi:hypothetical protein